MTARATAAAAGLILLAACNATLPSDPAMPADDPNAPNDPNAPDAARPDAPPPEGDTQGPRPVLDAAARDRTITGPRRDTATASDAFFGVSRCPEGVTFCEDFEGTALDPAKWMTDFVGSSMTFDRTRFARGASAGHLKITALLGSSLAHVDTVKTFPLTASGSVFVRAFYYVDSLTPNRWFWLLVATDGAGNDLGLNLVPTSETIPNVPALYRWVGTGGIKDSGQRAPLGAWVCHEVEFRGRSEVHLYVNGEEIPDMAIKGWPAMNQVRLSFRVELTHDDAFKHPDGFNVWIDGVAVGNDRIGCTR